MATRRRLDAEMLRRNLVPSREAAKREIEAGRVTVGGAPVSKPARLVSPDDSIQMLGPPPKYVSRAGLKLAGALEAFEIDVDGRRALDAGSSTGGFTDCLVQAGAAHVYSVDVGTHQLHERLRRSRRVTLYEQTDIRNVTLDHIDNAVDIVVTDVSFISLGLVLPALFSLINADGELVLLVKPQFEAGRVEVSRGAGVIADPKIWRRVLDEVWTHVVELGGAMLGAMVSPITGRSGNVEFIIHVAASERPDSKGPVAADCFDQIVEQATLASGISTGAETNAEAQL